MFIYIIFTFLTYTAISRVPTNTHILKLNLVKTSTAIHASLVPLRTAHVLNTLYSTC